MAPPRAVTKTAGDSPRPARSARRPFRRYSDSRVSAAEPKGTIRSRFPFPTTVR